MTSGPAAEDAVLELQRHEIDAVDIQKIGGAAIRIDVLFGQFKTHPGWILVAVFVVVYREGDTSRAGLLGGDRLTQIRSERRDTALARQVVTDKGNTIAV